MGISSGEVHWKTYGKRDYWMAYKNRNYSELLETVQIILQKFKIQA